MHTIVKISPFGRNKDFSVALLLRNDSFLFLLVQSFSIEPKCFGSGCKPDNHIEGTSERTFHGKMEDTVKGE